MSTLTQTQFDYDSLGELGPVVQGIAAGIRRNVATATEALIEVGVQLAEAQRIVPDGKWGEWLDSEFAWSADTAERWIRVAQYFPSIPQIAEFQKGALYLLASPNVPQSARDDAIQRAESGERITKAVAEEIVEQVRGELTTDEPDYEPEETSRPQQPTAFESADELDEKDECVNYLRDAVEYLDARNFGKQQIVDACYAAATYAKRLK